MELGPACRGDPQIVIDHQRVVVRVLLADPSNDRSLCEAATTPESGVQQGEDWSDENEELQAGAVLLHGVPGFIPRSKTRTWHTPAQHSRGV